MHSCGGAGDGPHGSGPCAAASGADGITTTVGWSYNSTDQSVEFEPDAIPLGGSTVEIGYAVKGGCEG